MMRGMLEESQQPRKYYGEALKTAVYLYNRLIHGKEEKSPFELMYSYPARLDGMRVFGSVCYAFIPAELRDKLDAVRNRCRF
jgi:hypothetical protein